ncbi:hypothetical protein CMUS01_03250 [Colletotrichum musicola]|uniref:Uncharacterized protein n=1 Tax=Colletotrichum musicola TaxID=2175873 RepID=A0A8H6NTH0_9PEZI|nr:hypothetical protein CMUS01_03250 [Colletotrichum musicola]
MKVQSSPGDIRDTDGQDNGVRRGRPNFTKNNRHSESGLRSVDRNGLAAAAAAPYTPVGAEVHRKSMEELELELELRSKRRLELGSRSPLTHSGV